ncbi:hypothetical protein RRG08_004111 [Elysia crispata]|uniref:Uncharacterized protein n=1 Tax=Elysia crispata TaxID=231223 RepID=A0AAE0YW51_9GAST|nr:hypothetical protein RRG08_004111 [Elysia crispata]
MSQDVRDTPYITNDDKALEVPLRAGLPSMYSIVTQAVKDYYSGSAMCAELMIPKDIMYGELATGTQPAGRPILCYRDVCKQT